MGLTDEEYQMISEEILGRLPNYTETGLFSVMWSEHCSYKIPSRSCANFQPKARKFYKGQAKSGNRRYW